ncbi:class I SAM-dependent methyltransferase [Mesoplasma chauliocola]|nr:class I SAM-dependent methyltransferase [Mesoplasma chauliocola]
MEKSKNYYGSLSSTVYDESKPPGTSIDGDIDFYIKELMPRDGLVLEAGVGNGRMAIPLLRRGIEVFAIDNSKEMLSLYKNNLIKYNMESEYLEADLSSFEVNKKFETIIMPNGSFCLLNRKDIFKILKNFKLHLTENGRIYIDLIFPTSFSAGKIHEFNFKTSNSEIIQIKNKAISINWLEQKTYSEIEYKLNEQNENQHFTLWWYGVEEFTKILEDLEFKNIHHIVNYNNLKQLNLKTLTFIFEK